MGRTRRPSARGALITRRRVTIALLIAAAVPALVIGLRPTSGPTGRRAPALPSTVLVPPLVRVDQLRGKPAAINFWASWCDPCRREAPALEQFARGLHGRARLVGVNWNDSLSAARKFVKEFGWTFPVLRDADGLVGNAYGITGLPTTFILDRSGRIAQILRGPQGVGDIRAGFAHVGA